MKLIIQIPCYNEEEVLPETLKHVPRSIDGINEIEIMIVDDGSTDRTVEVARTNGVHHVLERPHQGLAAAFASGMEHAVEKGADIIVNMDADNQHPGEKIPEIIRPILDSKAGMVIACRNIYDPAASSLLKRIYYRVGAWTVNFLTGLNVPDPTCGFRAFSRDTAMRIHVASNYSYTVDTIIQAAIQKIPIARISIKVVQPARKSTRLFKSKLRFIYRQSTTILRVFVYHRPLVFFLFIAAVFFFASAALAGRYIYLFFVSGGAGHVKMVIASGVLFLTSFLMFILGIIADMLGYHRKMLNEIIYLLRKNK